MTLQQIHDALDELVSILHGRGTPDADDAVQLRLAELQISLAAIAATRQRNVVTGGKIATLASARLASEIAWLAHDVLDYYALPIEPLGSNEPPPGPTDSPRLRSLFLKGLCADECEVMRLKDDLADFIARVKV